MTVRVQKDNFDLGAELKAMINDNHAIGGLCSFTGLVRDMNHDGQIGAMTLEHYPGMTEKMLERIDDEANTRWKLDASLIIHRYGRLEPGEQIVLVAAASAHRKAAFDACYFLIDFLKTKAPFWKIEEDKQGHTQWVEAKSKDAEATNKWHDK